MKQDRFVILQPNGTPDYLYETVNGEQVKRAKVNRPKALCFDYLQLKDMFGLELETELMSDFSETEEVQSQNGRVGDDSPQQGYLPF